MRPVPSAPVFSRAELRALGWSDPAVTRAVRSGRLLRLRRDQFTADEPAPRLAAIAAARACSGSVVSHRSAAIIHAIPLLGTATTRPELTVQPTGTGDVERARLHRATLREEDVVDVDGVLITSPARTAFDLARHHSTADGVVALDFVLHARLARRDELDDLARMCHNWPGIRRAQRALRLADGRAESPLESLSRLALRWLKLPAPRLQVNVFDEFAHHCGRVDFYWDDVGVVGEADGRGKYDSRQVLVAEKEREERLADLGLIVVRWGWVDVRQAPYLLGRRLERAFDRGRLRDRSGSPRLWSV